MAEKLHLEGACEIVRMEICSHGGTEGDGGTERGFSRSSPGDGESVCPRPLRPLRGLRESHSPCLRGSPCLRANGHLRPHMTKLFNPSFSTGTLKLMSRPFARSDCWAPSGNVYDSYNDRWYSAASECWAICESGCGVGWRGYGQDPNWGVQCQNWSPFWLLSCRCGEPFPE